MNWVLVLYTITDIALYSLAGIILLGVGVSLVFLLLPFPIRREIRDEQNRALSVLMGAIIVGIAIIIAAVMFSPTGLPSLWSGQSIENTHTPVVEAAVEKAKQAEVKKTSQGEPVKK